MKNNLSDMQLKMLDMMKWFHKYCGDHNIAYYMIGGTMLGAARHQGFIPWDDDIDVGIPRADYERLLKCSRELQSEGNQYIIESYHDGNYDFQYAYAKVYDTSTTLIENKRTKPRRGLFIDVFPLDGIAGETKEEAISNYLPVKRKLDLLAARACEVRNGRSWWKNIIVRIVGYLPPSILKISSLLSALESICRSNDFYKSRYAGNLVGMWREKEIMPQACFGVPTLYPFEDTKFFGVEKFDEYLQNVYGNWRKLPSIEKQKSEHDFLLVDLNKSYKVQ